MALNPKSVPTLCACTLAMVMAPAAAATAAGVEDFYKGKTVQIIVGVSPGGIYSTFAQILAKHMGNYIPGHPKLIVQHKPGAGGSKAVAYVYQVAAKDGTAIITPNAGVALRVMLGIIKGAYDPTKFTWVGGWGEAANVLTLRKDIAPVMTLEEAKKKEVILGAIGRSSNTYLIPAMINNTLGTKFRIITGYRGGSPIRLAIEKGEVHGWAGQWVGWKLRKPDWVREGKLVHLVQMASKPVPELSDIPLLASFARNDFERKMFSIVQTGIADRALAIPPGVPADRVKALGDAYQKTLRDPGFLAVAKKSQYVIDPIPGERIQKFVNDMMSTPPDTVKKMRQTMGLE